MKIGRRRDKFTQSMMLFCKNLNQQSSRSILHFFSEKLHILLSKCQVPVKLNCRIYSKSSKWDLNDSYWTMFPGKILTKQRWNFLHKRGLYFLETITIKIQNFLMIWIWAFLCKRSRLECKPKPNVRVYMVLLQMTFKREGKNAIEAWNRNSFFFGSSC